MFFKGFGSDIEEIVMLNVPMGTLTTTAKVFYALAIFTSIPLFIHAAFELIEKTQCYNSNTMPFKSKPNVSLCHSLFR